MGRRDSGHRPLRSLLSTTNRPRSLSYC